MKVKIGDNVPKIKLEATNGEEISLTDFKGKK